MSTRVSEYPHVISTLEVYPRLYYFQKRYKDVYKRFLNIINEGPHTLLFKKSELLDTLEELKHKLEIPLKIWVIGQDNLEKEELVITTEPLERVKTEVSLFPQQTGSKSSTEEQGLTVCVAYADIRDIGHNGLKDVEETVSHFLSSFGKVTPMLVHTLMIVCHTSTAYTLTEIEKFRSSVIDNLKQSFGLDITTDRVIMGKGDQILSTQISQMLEAEILNGFFSMRQHLQGFVCNKGRLNMVKADVLETEQVAGAIQGFLKNGLGLVDILEDSRSENLPFVDIVLRHLARIIRCAILEPLSVKVNLPQDICNQMAFELKFEDGVKKSVSKNTQYHLSKLEHPSEELIKAQKEGNRSHRFPGRNFIFIAYPLRDDVRKVVIQLENDLLSLQKTTKVMKKMIFEIDGNIKQSIISADDINRTTMTENVPKETTKTEKVPKELRKEILKVDGVYGVGTLYDEFEIHVKSDEAKESVRAKLRQYNFKRSVRVRKVTGIPERLVGRQVEHGIVIQCPYPGEEERFRSGTLGIFVVSNNGELYALTCAHVVCEERNVYIYNGNGERELFATCDPNMTILTGDSLHPLVDIAAVKVNNVFCPECTKFLKDDDGMLKCAELSRENPDELRGRYIYKYGAASHLTHGMVCSEDYTLTNGPDDYLILVTCPPGSDTEGYAKRGDSGSVNCMPNVKSNETVIAVSMLSAGELKLEGLDDPIAISFRLDTGLQKLKNRPGGIHFHVPNIYADEQKQKGIMH